MAVDVREETNAQNVKVIVIDDNGTTVSYNKGTLSVQPVDDDEQAVTIYEYGNYREKYDDISTNVTVNGLPVLNAEDFRIKTKDFFFKLGGGDGNLNPGDLPSNAISVTHADASTLANSSSLEQGNWYLLTNYYQYQSISDGTSDFKTIFNDNAAIPIDKRAIDADWGLGTGTREPLLLYAATTDSFAKEAISMIFPEDIIEYQLQGPFGDGSTRGRIMYRRTPEGDEGNFDIRSYIVCLWESVPFNGKYYSTKHIAGSNFRYAFAVGDNSRTTLTVEGENSIMPQKAEEQINCVIGTEARGCEISGCANNVVITGESYRVKFSSLYDQSTARWIDGNYYDYYEDSAGGYAKIKVSAEIAIGVYNVFTTIPSGAFIEMLSIKGVGLGSDTNNAAFNIQIPNAPGQYTPDTGILSINNSPDTYYIPQPYVLSANAPLQVEVLDEDINAGSLIIAVKWSNLTL